jgi:outer membrane protein assembly factor BamB
LSLIALIVIVASTASPLISSVSAQVPPGIDEPWPSFGATPDNHRAVDGSGPKNMGLKWRYETDGPLSGSASLAYGNVYFGSYDGNYYCLDAESGALKWKYTAEWEARDTPCISDGKVYTGDSDGNFYCLDAYTGAVIWKTPTEKGLITGEFPPGETWNARSSPQVVDGKVYVGSTDFNIYCMDAATGTPIWKYPTENSIISSPAVANGKVYIGSDDGLFYCVDAATGELVWSSDWSKSRVDANFKNRGISGSPCVIDDKVIYFSHAGAWLCHNAETGEELWKYHTFRIRSYFPMWNLTAPFKRPNPPEYCGVGTNPTVCVTPSYHDGIVHVNEDFWLLTLNVDEGSSRDIPFPNGIFNYDLFTGFVSYPSTAYAAGSGTIYSGSACKSVYCNDAFEPLRHSWYETHGQIWSSPSIAYEKCYIGSLDWFMYCLDDNGPVRETSDPNSWKTPTSTTINLDTTEVEINEPICISGETAPPMPNDPLRGGGHYLINITRPDGSTVVKTSQYDKDQYGYYSGLGTYSYDYKPDMTGTWTVWVTFLPSLFDTWIKSETETLTFTVTPETLPTPASGAASTFSPVLIYAISAAVAILIVIVIYLVSGKR